MHLVRKEFKLGQTGAMLTALVSEGKETHDTSGDEVVNMGLAHDWLLLT